MSSLVPHVKEDGRVTIFDAKGKAWEKWPIDAAELLAEDSGWSLTPPETGESKKGKGKKGEKDGE